MVHKEHITTRIEMMQKWETEMKAFHEHDGRAVWIKSKVDWLKHNLLFGDVLIKGDFIQNISHSWGKEADAAYYNKHQTQFLTFVVWYHTEDSTEESSKIAMQYVDYLSGYLKHTSLFFQKCFLHLVRHLKDTLLHTIRKVNTTSTKVLCRSTGEPARNFVLCVMYKVLRGSTGGPA